MESYNKMLTNSGEYVTIGEVILVKHPNGPLAKLPEEMMILRDFGMFNVEVEDENGITRWIDRSQVMPIR